MVDSAESCIQCSGNVNFKLSVEMLLCRFSIGLSNLNSFAQSSL